MIKPLLASKTSKFIFWLNALLFICFAGVEASLLITPGYGTSDYFQLMPNKVKNKLGAGRAGSVSCRGFFTSAHFENRRLVLNVANHLEVSGITILLFDMRGKVVFRHSFKQPASERTVISLPTHVMPGLYLVKVQSQGNTSIARAMLLR